MKNEATDSHFSPASLANAAPPFIPCLSLFSWGSGFEIAALGLLAHMQRLRPELANNDLSAKYAPPATLMQSHKCKYPFGAKQKDFLASLASHSPWCTTLSLFRLLSLLSWSFFPSILASWRTPSHRLSDRTQRTRRNLSFI